MAPPRSVPRLSSSRRFWFGVSWRCSEANSEAVRRSTSAAPHSGQRDVLDPRPDVRADQLLEPSVALRQRNSKIGTLPIYNQAWP